MTALACEFGWTEEYILALPLKRANQYYHALLRRANWRTYAPEAFDVQEQVATLEGDRAEMEVAMPAELAAAMARWGIEEAGFDEGAR